MAVSETRFAGRVALVTGGASGIGFAIAERLAAEGAAIAVADRDFPAAEGAAAELRRRGAKAIALGVDVADEGQVARAVEDAVAGLGGLHILAASAGTNRPMPLRDMPLAVWSEILAVNLTGMFLCVREAARPMARQRYGRMVLIASTCAQRAASDRAAYGASKGGVVSLMQSAACEFAADGITVNAISPGPIDSPMSRRNHSAGLRRTILDAAPLGRYGDAAEVAAAAAFLASEEASYVTGHELTVDGGAAAALYIDRK